jgi:hypothetical protein
MGEQWRGEARRETIVEPDAGALGAALEARREASEQQCDVGR